MSLGETNSLRHRTRQVLLKGRQDLNSKPQVAVDLMHQNLDHLSRRQSNLYTAISGPSNWDEVATVRGNLNQLLGIANPSTATALGGVVVGGVPLVGDFYPTATPLATSLPNNARTASPQTSAGLIRPTPSSSLLPSSSRLGTTQAPRATEFPPINTPSFSMMPSAFESSMNKSDSYERSTLPGGAIAGIAIAALLLILTIILGCWYFYRLRHAKIEQRRKKTDSFLRNPIVNSLLLNPSSSSFRGTPYPGEEGDMYYAGPPSIVSNHNLRFGDTFRFSHRPQQEAMDDSHLNEVNYLDVKGGSEPILSLTKNYNTEPLRVNSPKKVHLQTLSSYTEIEDQNFGERINSQLSFESQVSRTQHSSFASPFSARSLIFPQVAIFRSGPKNEAGIPIQNLEANRITSQIATPTVGRNSYNERDQRVDSGNFQSRKGEEDFLPFYLPRAGDPEKIIYDRTETNQRSAIPTTNFSYPMPRVLQEASPPEPSVPIDVDEDMGFSGSTATPSFSNNRYMPNNKGRKAKQNAKVVSILHKSSLRKSSSKALSMSKRHSQLMPKRLSATFSKRQSALMSKRQSASSKRADRSKIFSVNSIDVPDPYGQDFFG